MRRDIVLGLGSRKSRRMPGTSRSRRKRNMRRKGWLPGLVSAAALPRRPTAWMLARRTVAGRLENLGRRDVTHLASQPSTLDRY